MIGGSVRCFIHRNQQALNMFLLLAVVFAYDSDLPFVYAVLGLFTPFLLTLIIFDWIDGYERVESVSHRLSGGGND